MGKKNRLHDDFDHPAWCSPLPQDRMDALPWLVVGSHLVLVSPFPSRKEGPTEAEAAAIRAMQRRLARGPRAGLWVDPINGRMTTLEITADALRARVTSHASVRLPAPLTDEVPGVA